eukprot:gene33495-41339_t
MEEDTENANSTTHTENNTNLNENTTSSSAFTTHAQNNTNLTENATSSSSSSAFTTHAQINTNLTDNATSSSSSSAFTTHAQINTKLIENAVSTEGTNFSFDWGGRLEQLKCTSAAYFDIWQNAPHLPEDTNDQQSRFPLRLNPGYQYFGGDVRLGVHDGYNTEREVPVDNWEEGRMQLYNKRQHAFLSHGSATNGDLVADICGLTEKDFDNVSATKHRRLEERAVISESGDSSSASADDNILDHTNTSASLGQDIIPHPQDNELEEEDDDDDTVMNEGDELHQQRRAAKQLALLTLRADRESEQTALSEEEFLERLARGDFDSYKVAIEGEGEGEGEASTGGVTAHPASVVAAAASTALVPADTTATVTTHSTGGVTAPSASVVAPPSSTVLVPADTTITVTTLSTGGVTEPPASVVAPNMCSGDPASVVVLSITSQERDEKDAQQLADAAIDNLLATVNEDTQAEQTVKKRKKKDKKKLAVVGEGGLAVDPSLIDQSEQPAKKRRKKKDKLKIQLAVGGGVAVDPCVIDLVSSDSEVGAVVKIEKMDSTSSNQNNAADRVVHDLFDDSNEISSAVGVIRHPDRTESQHARADERAILHAAGHTILKENDARRNEAIRSEWEDMELVRYLRGCADYLEAGVKDRETARRNRERIAGVANPVNYPVFFRGDESSMAQIRGLQTVHDFRSYWNFAPPPPK